MEGDENNFLGVDKQSNMTTVQGKMITPSEATNSVGKFLRNIFLVVNTIFLWL